MAFISRRTGIAGITAGALMCLICGIPFIAALLGVGGISLTAIFSDISIQLKIAMSIVGVATIALLIFIFIRKSAEQSKESDV